MTRKDYVLIAKTLHDTAQDIFDQNISGQIKQRDYYAMRVGIFTVISEMSKALAEDNPRFDAERFEEAATLHAF
jgi:hypothetical protein